MNIREYFDLLRQTKTDREVAQAMPTLTCPECGCECVPEFWDGDLTYICGGDCEQEWAVDVQVNPDTGEIVEAA